MLLIACHTAGPSYPEMSREAIQNALDDAGITFNSIEAAVSYFLAVNLFELFTECRICVW